MGPQDDRFTGEGIRCFLSETYTLASQSDRVGCRLTGPRIGHRRGADIVSDGTAFGSVQVSGDGMPIVLMADRGTTGGYTKIATVASADLSRVAQAAPGDRVRFVQVGVDEAQALLRIARAQLELDRPRRGVEGALRRNLRRRQRSAARRAGVRRTGGRAHGAARSRGPSREHHLRGDARSGRLGGGGCR